MLLATEAASLSLSENWLTTLSACETGAGTSQDGECAWSKKGFYPGRSSKSTPHSVGGW